MTAQLVTQSGPCSRLAYATKLSEEHAVSIKDIQILMRCVENGDTLPTDMPSSYQGILEIIVEDMERTGVEIDPVLVQECSKVRCECKDTPEEPEEVLGAVEAQEIPHEGDGYKVFPEIEAKDVALRMHVSPLIKEIPSFVPDDAPVLNSQELGIVEAAKNARLDNAYGELREVFQFDDSMLTVKVKEGAIASPEDWGRLSGFAFDLGRRSVWLLSESLCRLLALNHENSVIQIAAEFGISSSYCYNLARAAQRVPEDLRSGIIPTAALELCNGRYDKDESKNQEIIVELLNEARDKKLSCAEARSLKQMKLGREEPVEGKESLKDKCMRLEGALSEILKLDVGEDISESSYENLIDHSRAIARKALGLPTIVEQ